MELLFYFLFRDNIVSGSSGVYNRPGTRVRVLMAHKNNNYLLVRAIIIIVHGKSALFVVSSFFTPKSELTAMYIRVNITSLYID